MPVNCAVAWGAWSACSAECGPGVETQTGTVTQKPSATGAQCPESLSRTRPCQLRLCLGTVFLQAGAAPGRADVVNPGEKVVLGVSFSGSASGRRLQDEGGNATTKLTFRWSGGGGNVHLTNPVPGRFLVFKPGTLAPGKTYVFACTISDGVDQTTSKVRAVCIMHSRPDGLVGGRIAAV